MARNKPKIKDNFLYLKIFLIFVFVCIVVSASLKTANLVKTSNFDSQYYNILVIGSKAYIVNIQKVENSISVIELKGRDSNYFHNNFRQKISVDIGIPLDAVFIDNKDRPFKDPKEFFSFKNIIGFLLEPASYKSEELNKLDLVKIYFATYSVSLFDVNSASLDLLREQEDDRDEKLFEHFKDKQILSEKTSVEVVNASGIDGIAWVISRMFKNVGFNVISVKSADKEQVKSIIICRNSGTYSIDRISRVFPILIEYKNETGIADISVIIGKDGKWTGD